MSKITDWTQATVYCYKRLCNCNNCKYVKWTHYTCQAKKSVVKLLKTVGKPPKKMLEYQEF